MVRFSLRNPVRDFWAWEEGYQNPILYQSGYKQYSLIPNLGLIYVAILILFTVIFITQRCLVLSPSISNFTVRFAMEVFLEVILCAMINFNQPYLLTLGDRMSVASAAGLVAICLGFIIVATFLSHGVDEKT